MRFKKFKGNKLLFIFFSALIIRVVVSLLFYENEVWEKFADDNSRLAYSEYIIENGFLSEIERFDITRKETLFAPFLPAIMSVKILLLGYNWLPLFLLNAIIGSLLCLVIYKISRFYFNEEISLLAAAWAALYPNYIRYIGTAGNEPWIVLFFALSFLFAIKLIENREINISNLIALALFVVLLFHTDERYLTYIPLFVLLLLAGQGSFILKLKKIVLFSIFLILLSLPWQIRNNIVYNDFVIVTCRTTSLTKHFINHREEVLFYDHTPNRSYLSYSQLDSIQKGLLTSFPNGKPIYPGQIEAIKEGNVPYAFNTKEKIFSRLYFLWVPFKFHDNYRITGYAFNPAWSLKHNLMTGLSYGLLLPFALLAFVFLIRKKRWKKVYLFGSIIVFHTLIHITFIPYTRDRYRHPIDFIIIILGIYGIFILYDLIKSRKSILTD